ncbi:HNH endonuclease [Pseudomonas sp. BBP2017]|uniref:HNH endonuclease n=1 Tax=Pseudomonas sp. BBP2017 TaxID=2109731 RepID=UPI000D12A27B|nr:HNH endonuclease signature motif containing protein [Pseudomonas sp. BBP2017]PSS58859.1 HNH endonuclease [Pseudomonas sp. BBP2017]
MTFEDWMRYKGLSLSSVKKYDGAVRGVMSEWAIDNKLVEGPLVSLSSQSEFEVIASKIRALPIYKERNERGHHMYSSALIKFSEYLSEGRYGDVESDIDDILCAGDISETEKINLVKSRIGQGVFRQKLVGYWACCAMSGFKDVNLLVASHIKPWSASSNSERLDPFNGFLLTPNLDKAFDKGYITLSPAGVVNISPHLKDSGMLGISPNIRVSLAPEHEPFLEFHRSVVFRAT